jgi:hypothetical protein
MATHQNHRRSQAIGYLLKHAHARRVVPLFFAGCQLLHLLGQENATVVLAQETESPRKLAETGSAGHAESFTLIILPDTQGYADTRHQETQKHWPGIGDQRTCFFKQTEWIRENQQHLNIRMAIHVGDITQTDAHEEWQIADTAFKTLDKHVPYALCSGNHDMGYSPRLRTTSQSRQSGFSAYFPPSRFTDNALYDPLFGRDKDLHFRETGKIENYYLFLKAGGMNFLILTLEFKPRRETLAWANKIVAEHPDHRTIVVTHSYLTSQKGERSRKDHYAVKGQSGQSVWETFVSRHQNIFMVLSGHAMENRLTSEGEHGNMVHQVQADYWYWDIPRIQAGSGFLRIMTFHTDEDRIQVETYSPVLDEFLTRPKSQFSLKYPMRCTGK